MTPNERREGLRAVAAGLSGLDHEAYAAAHKDPFEPILAAGDPSAKVCIFGRDPGRDEVKLGLPFVGAGGRAVRQALHRHFHRAETRDPDALLATTSLTFWANTVPYKPAGNKAWPLSVRQQCLPWVADLLVHGWTGSDVLCMGENAFGWFGLADPQAAGALSAAWEEEPRFQGRPVEVLLRAPDGTARKLRVWSLPHPSPLNATWKSRFPGLMLARLQECVPLGD
jgi:uracil-DNA glycosylase